MFCSTWLHVLLCISCCFNCYFSYLAKVSLDNFYHRSILDYMGNTSAVHPPCNTMYRFCWFQCQVALYLFYSDSLWKDLSLDCRNNYQMLWDSLECQRRRRQSFVFIFWHANDHSRGGENLISKHFKIQGRFFHLNFLAILTSDFIKFLDLTIKKASRGTKVVYYSTTFHQIVFLWKPNWSSQQDLSNEPINSGFRWVQVHLNCAIVRRLQYA